jgi:hypothetical protein
MKKTLLVLFLTLSFAANGLAQMPAKVGGNATRGAEGITAAQLKDYLYFVASDEMEGRNTPSRGLDTTAKFIAMNLSRWGFKPAGDDGTFFQKIALKRTATDAAKTILDIGGQRLAYGSDYFASAGAAKLAGAPMVYVGNGWFIKSKNIDAYQGIDVKGKTVVIYGNDFPRGVAQTDLTGQRGVDWIDPATYARQKGASAIVIITSPEMESDWQKSREQIERGSISVEKFQANNQPRFQRLPTIYLSRKAAENLFQSESSSFAQVSQADVAGFNFNAAKSLNFSEETAGETLYTQNVVAIWEGSDPVLRNEMVAVGAHYDHVGNSPSMGCRPVNGDSLCNGADDDGSGTVGVLSIAEALAKAPKKPKRSVLFVWHCGEEKGLWGSRYFAQYPTSSVDLSKVVAQLNIDMIGRSKKAGDTNPKNAELSGENEIYVIGSKMMSTQLGDLSEAVNKSYLNIQYNYRYDDPKDPNRFFFRSDHFNYAQKGIPIIFWFDGVHEDYHQPGDSPDKIDYNKMEKVSRTVFATMYELADAKSRPTVDKQLPAELTGR